MCSPNGLSPKARVNKHTNPPPDPQLTAAFPTEHIPVKERPNLPTLGSGMLQETEILFFWQNLCNLQDTIYCQKKTHNYVKLLQCRTTL